MAEILEDLSLDLDICNRELWDLPLNVSVADYFLEDAKFNLSLDSSLQLVDLSLNLDLTDGVVYEDVGLNLLVIDELPTFKGIYAMHLESVLYDETS